MAEFAEKWTKEERGSLGERIRETLKPSGPLRPRLESAIRALQIQIAKLDSASARLKERDSAIFSRVVSAIQKHDTARASMYANELAEIRKMSKMVLTARIALEQIVLRLNTVQDLGDIVVTLAPAMAVIRSIKAGIVSVLPEAEREIGEISGMLNSLMVDAGQLSGYTLSFEAASEDAEKILAEATVVAEQRMKERFPELPTAVPSGTGLPEAP